MTRVNVLLSPALATVFVALLSHTAIGRSPAVVPPAAPLLSALRVEQRIVKKQFAYETAPSARISFLLTKASPVSVFVKRHLAASRDFQSATIAEPYLVRTFNLGRLNAGTHELTWDGLNPDGSPVTEKNIVPYDALMKLGTNNPRPGQLVTEVPVDLFQIEVSAGANVLYSNFRRLPGTVDPSRSTLSFMGAVVDSAGNAIVADRIAWRAHTFSPTWRLHETFPGASAGQSSDPVECYDVAVDSTHNVYAMTRSGVYKFAADGSPASWASSNDYINFPYPGITANVLGVRLDPSAKPKKEYVFGPGGGGGRKYWTTSEEIDKPGFALNWGGLAIDARDQIYLGRTEPKPEIQVFDSSGKWLRTLPLPAGAIPAALRATLDGALWMATGTQLLRVDAMTGAIQKTIDCQALLLTQGPGGLLYGLRYSRVWRYTDAGNPAPFLAQSPYQTTSAGQGGNCLDLGTREHKVPENAAGYTNNAMGLVADSSGGFLVSETPPKWGSVPSRLLHYSREGFFEPEALSVTLGAHRPGNVFVDDAPPQFDLYASNLDPAAQAVAGHWTLTDFDGKQTTGAVRLGVAGLTHEVLPLVLPPIQPGHYTLQVDLDVGGHQLTPLSAQLARVASRDLHENRYSPFAIVWGTNFYLMSLAGVKSNRGDSASWGRKYEPLPGVFYPTLPSAIQYGTGDIDTYRRYARRNGTLMLNGLDYGEEWLGGDYPGCRIYSYDRFFEYALETLDTFGYKGEAFYQLWNEPNFFWHAAGPFSREHFGLVTQHIWSIVKARDKNAMLIPDGDAGGTAMMTELAAHGANEFDDGVQIHYPGSTPLSFDNMPVPDLPEGKVPMIRQLAAIRDSAYPGKPIWNTEEGWWGASVKTPEVGAELVPRTFLPQIAAGVDKLYYFSQTGLDTLNHDPTCLLDENNEPFPAYAAYATMTRLLEDAPYIGSPQIADGVFAYAFARPDDVVLALYSAHGPRKVVLSAGTATATVVDLMGRSTLVKSVGGKLPLTLTARTQYLVLPRGGWAATIGKAELANQLAAWGQPNAAALPAAIATASETAASDPAVMNRLFHLTKALELAALLENFRPTAQIASAEISARAARAAVEAREGDDGYLRRGRLALDWTEREAQLARRGGRRAPGLTRVTDTLATATRTIAASENPSYPGCVVNAYLEPKSVRTGADPKQPLDERFAFEIDRKAGDSFDMELTVWDYYRHPIMGSVEPRLPGGWTATGGPQHYEINPGKFARFTWTVRIPPVVKPGVWFVGGTTTYHGQTIPEIHAQRIRITAH